MAHEQFLVLGGYGLAGRLIARMLLEYTPVSLIVAGRHGDQAAQLAAELNDVFSGERARGIAADATNPASLAEAFRDVSLVIDCTPTTQHISKVTRAVLDAGVDYLDILYGPNKVNTLKDLESEIEQKGLCFITEAGYHPGLPSVFVRYAAEQLNPLESAVVGGLLNVPLPYTEAVEDLVREIEHSGAGEYKDGAWHTMTWNSTGRKFDFGPPHGVRSCFPMEFHEMRALPERYGLRETGFYIASLNWFADMVVFLPWYVFKLGRFDWGARLGAKLLVWSAKTFARPPYEVVLKVEAEGCVEGRPMRLDFSARHPDGYVFTAIPVVACLLQYLDGTIRQPGLWIMGQAVEPGRMIRDMERMGVCTEERLAPLRQITS